ncbi:PRC-barrel domain-containing protein [Tepidibacillus sp. LV47]|uniref:PRC-barrel domain-containing protein n=1 Tax=Tepidibacillus sp. LV47 TaxID=3398228 RepID=UPI003AADF18F
MRKVLDVIGLPVLDTSSGKMIGSVKDVYFNDRGELMGIAVEAKGLFSKTAFLAFEHIGAIGDDAVTVGTKRFLSTLDPIDQYHGFYSGKSLFKGQPIITTNGHELGHIEDVYFMEEMGKIIGYELSDGLLSDITEGRRVIQFPKKVIFGEDAMIVPKEEIRDIQIE